MKNRELAEHFLADAKALLSEARVAQRRRRIHRSIRLGQEAVELASKACLRALGIEYPKAHDVSDALEANRDKLPGWFRAALPSLVRASAWLAAQRGPAMYGDEVGGVPAAELFGVRDGVRAVHAAARAVVLADRLLREFFGKRTAP